MADHTLIYGTAWKGDGTADLVYQALKAGFRAVATAAQPKHYREHLVGEGIARAIRDGVVARADIFVSSLAVCVHTRRGHSILTTRQIQTTFTPYPSQDPANLPYDPDAPLDVQVRTSLANSLATFSSSSSSSSKPYLDALVLHIPYAHPSHTNQVWAAMSRAVRDGHVRQLGISNTSLATLTALVAWCVHQKTWTNPDDAADVVPLVLPTIVQNRFHPGDEGDFDGSIRHFCAHPVAGGVPVPVITYQSFGALRIKPLVHDEASTGVVATKLRVSPQVALYALMIEALAGDVRVLNGTTKEERMSEDWRDVGKAVAALKGAKQDPTDELYQAMASFRSGLGEDS